jgi:hypothetical protein
MHGTSRSGIPKRCPDPGSIQPRISWILILFPIFCIDDVHRTEKFRIFRLFSKNTRFNQYLSLQIGGLLTGAGLTHLLITGSDRGIGI